MGWRDRTEPIRFDNALDFNARVRIVRRVDHLGGVARQGRQMSRRGLAGLYERRIFPWINDSVAYKPEFEALRREALAPARGRVVEMGFGSGASLGCYPPAVTSVTGVEPNDGMLARARPRVAVAGARATLVQAAAEHLPLSDASADTVVSVLTLCSVSDTAAVLAEIRRILRPDGQLLVAEHGLADDPDVVRWQHRLNPLQKLLACGCHLDRPVVAIIASAGFRFEAVRSFHVPGTPRTHGWLTVGQAVKTPVDDIMEGQTRPGPEGPGGH